MQSATMFLHSGASLHGHEYSNRNPSNDPTAHHNLGPPLLRSSLVSPKMRIAKLAVDKQPSPSALKQSSVCDYASYLPTVRFREGIEVCDEPTSPSVRFKKVDESVAEKEKAPKINDNVSESELSDTTQSTETPSSSGKRRRRRRASRTSTTFSFGYPAPRLLGKKKMVQKVLPRLLLQLQQVFEDGRPRPVLEAYPASRIAGPVIAPRLAKKFSAILGVKRQLGWDDIVLFRRDDRDYDSEDAEIDEVYLEHRKILAVYSRVKDSEDAEIVLDDGAIWVASPISNGSWNFVHVDAMGNEFVARWARRKNTALATNVTGEPSEARYTFSIINPLSRRHPVMATMTKLALDVQDTYTSVSSSFGRYPPTRPMSWTRSASYPSSSQDVNRSVTNTPNSSTAAASALPSDSGINLAPDLDIQQTVNVIDERTKTIIAVTSFWVALNAGWSSTYTPITQVNMGDETNTSAASTPMLANSRRPVHTLEKMRSRSPLQEVPRPSSTMANPGTPRRAVSSGAAFMHRRIRLQESSGSGLETLGGHSSNPATSGNGPVRKKTLSTFYARCRAPPRTPEQMLRPHSPVVDLEETAALAAAEYDRQGLGSQSEARRDTSASDVDGVRRGQDAGLKRRFMRWIHRLGQR